MNGRHPDERTFGPYDADYYERCALEALDQASDRDETNEMKAILTARAQVLATLAAAAATDAAFPPPPVISVEPLASGGPVTETRTFIVGERPSSVLTCKNCGHLAGAHHRPNPVSPVDLPFTCGDCSSCYPALRGT